MGIVHHFEQLAEGRDHEETLGLISYFYRPGWGRSNAFDKARCGLGQFTLLAFRPQWRYFHGLRPSAVLSVFVFQYNNVTGRISVDAHRDEACNTIVWDTLLPPEVPLPLHLDPRKNITAARAAIVLNHAVHGAARYGHPVRQTPVFPGFHLGFLWTRPPQMERTAGLLAAVRMHLHVETPATEISDEVCQEVFDTMCVRDGTMIYVPHWLLSREYNEVFAVHPRQGTPMPETQADEGTQHEGWVMLDGIWTPKVQVPDVVVADLTEVLGREDHTAWEILVDHGHLPSMPHAVWAEQCSNTEWDHFRETVLTDLFPAGRRTNPLIEEWKSRTGTGNQYDAEDIVCLAFEDVRKPFVFETESKADVLQLQGSPSPETMTWRGFGLDVNMFDVRPFWSHGVQPLSARDVARARRGQAPLAPYSRKKHRARTRSRPRPQSR